MNLVAAVDENWGIGYKGQLLVRIPADQEYFRRITTGKVVVMGRKTLDTLPGKMPLAKRTNIILSTKKDFTVKYGTVVHSVEECLELLKDYPSEDIYVIGGESIYRQFLPYADTIHLTKIMYRYQADSHFPNIDEMPEWKLTADSEEQTYFDLEFFFQKYEREQAAE